MRRGGGKAVRELDGGRLLAAYPVAVPIEVRAVARLASANGRRAGGSRSRAVGERTSTAAARQGLWRSAGRRLSRTAATAVTMIAAVLSVVVTAFGIQPTRVSDSGGRENDDRQAQRDIQTLHVDPPEARGQ